MREQLTQTTGKIGTWAPMSPPLVFSSECSYSPVTALSLSAGGTTTGMRTLEGVCAYPLLKEAHVKLSPPP